MNWRIEQRAKLPGSHLKSSLTYPNGLTAAWSYEPTRDLLTQVVNAQPDGTVISSYTYTNDLLGHRTSKNDEQYGYNIRDELRMYRELYDILEEKYGSRLYCPYPIKIVIYEGEERRKDSYWSTDRVRMKYPERF